MRRPRKASEQTAILKGEGREMPVKMRDGVILLPKGLTVAPRRGAGQSEMALGPVAGEALEVLRGEFVPGKGRSIHTVKELCGTRSSMAHLKRAKTTGLSCPSTKLIPGHQGFVADEDPHQLPHVGLEVAVQRLEAPPALIHDLQPVLAANAVPELLTDGWPIAGFSLHIQCSRRGRSFPGRPGSGAGLGSRSSR